VILGGSRFTLQHLKSTRQERVLKDRRKALALEADTQRTVGIPRAAAAATAPLFCNSFAAGKQKKEAGKTERVQNESEKKGKEKKHKEADAEAKYKAEEAAG
jgi:hypothetical protein